MDFFTEGNVFVDSYFVPEKIVLNILMDLFLTNMQLFTTLTDGVDYWDVFQLFGLILTAPIHCRGCIDDQAMELC